MSAEPRADLSDVVAYLDQVGRPKTLEARQRLASHFRNQADLQKAKAAGLEEAAQLLEADEPLPVEPLRASCLSWLEPDGLTFTAHRLARSIRGIDTLVQLDGVGDHPLIEGQLHVSPGERGAILVWNGPAQADYLAFSIRPLTEKDARLQAAVLRRLGQALIEAGRRADYHAQIPEGKVCAACGEKPVQPDRWIALDEIQDHRDPNLCCLCAPTLKRAQAMDLEQVVLWNGRVLNLRYSLMPGGLDQMLGLL